MEIWQKIEICKTNVFQNVVKLGGAGWKGSTGAPHLENVSNYLNISEKITFKIRKMFLVVGC